MRVDACEVYELYEERCDGVFARRVWHACFCGTVRRLTFFELKEETES